VRRKVTSSRRVEGKRKYFRGIDGLVEVMTRENKTKKGGKREEKSRGY